MIKVLIVEDEFTIRSSLMHHFEDYDYEACGVESAEEGLKILESKEIDAVIVDLRLPGKSGDQFILEAYDITRNTVFLVHSGSTDYKMPDILKKLPRVSKTVFRKPLSELTILNDEISKMMSSNTE